jgi:hypothetical protein
MSRSRTLIGSWSLRSLAIAGVLVVQSGCNLLGGAGHVQPALFQTAPLRSAQGGADRIYFISTQSETVSVGGGRSISRVRTEYLHIDLWAIDAATANVTWRKRLRTYEGDARSGAMLRTTPSLRSGSR